MISCQHDTDEVPTRPDEGLSDQLRQVMRYYDSQLNEMRREHNSKLSEMQREHNSQLSEMQREQNKTNHRLAQLEAKLSQVNCSCRFIRILLKVYYLLLLKLYHFLKVVIWVLISQQARAYLADHLPHQFLGGFPSQNDSEGVNLVQK